MSHSHEHSHPHGNGHSHSHRHVHMDPDAGDGRIALAVIVNILLTVAQVIAGIFSGSLALIADALHNFSDAISLVIAFLARKIARRPANPSMTFGYGRAEPIAALINYVTLIIVSLYLMVEAVGRFFQPEPVEGWVVVIVAGIAFVIDFVTAALTFTMAKSSQNIRAAFLHNVADALGSIAVIFAGTLVILFGWWIVDPLITLLISVYSLWLALSEIGDVVKLLMLGSPTDLDPEEVLASLRAVPGVEDVHHAHLWRMQEHDSAFDAHVAIAEGRWSDADAIKMSLKAVLEERFGITHTTLELECATHACAEPVRFGHA